MVIRCYMVSVYRRSDKVKNMLKFHDLETNEKH